jgi:hypothetical protein
MFDALAQMISVLKPLELGGSKQPDHRCFSLSMSLQSFPDHDISRARKGQLQYPHQLALRMGAGLCWCTVISQRYGGLMAVPSSLVPDRQGGAG